MFNLPSLRFNSWAEAVAPVIIKQRKRIFENGLTVLIWFGVADNRKRDLTNMAEGVMDELVRHGVIQDDNVLVVSSIYLFCKKSNEPSTVIEIRREDDIARSA